jgi:hypothetical protein
MSVSLSRYRNELAAREQGDAPLCRREPYNVLVRETALAHPIKHGKVARCSALEESLPQLIA